jgi:catechol 2,3-dioxygenase-like lactoylglutathione lyase family enzyme
MTGKWHEFTASRFPLGSRPVSLLTPAVWREEMHESSSDNRDAGKVRMSRVSGVDHAGVGVRNREVMKSFYADVMGFVRVLGEMPERDHEAIHALLRTSPAVHSAIHLSHPAGGISVALFRGTTPVPRPIRKDFRYGDIGVTKMTMSVADVDQVYRDLRKSVSFCSEPKSVMIPGWKQHRFVYGKDPEGNLIEFISGPLAPAENGFGGVRWLGIGVTDLERSKRFYQRHLEFDRVVVESHQAFSGLLDEVSGGTGTEVRSCLLATHGGDGMIELFEVDKPRGRSIPFGVQWGDFGYLQVCLSGVHVPRMMAYCEAEGLEVLAAPQTIGDPEHGGAFMYLRDPDGIPVEYAVFY